MPIYHLPFKETKNTSFSLAKAYAVDLSSESNNLDKEKISGYMVFRNVDGADSCIPFRLSYTGTNAEIHACMDLMKFTALLVDYTNVALSMLSESEGLDIPLNITIHSITGSVNDTDQPIIYH